MKVNKSEARRRLARLYERQAAMYDAAASYNRNAYKAACFAGLAALYRRAACECVRPCLSACGGRSVCWWEVAGLLRESAA